MEANVDLDTGELRSFVVLAEQAHFGRASEVLGVTQPALSKRLRRLEEKVGGPLVVRGPGGVRLTGPGRVFLERARAFLREAEIALHVCRQAVRGEAGLLRIGFGIASIAELLPLVLLRFRRAFPNVQIQMRDMSSPAQSLALRREEIDVGFVRMPVPDPDIECEPILHERLVAALGPSASFREKEGLASLRQEPFVVCARSVSASYYDHVTALCRRAGFAPRIVQETGELLTLLQLVRAGIGVGLVPSAAASLRVPEVRFKDIPFAEAAWDIAIAWKRGNGPSPLVRAFVGIARQGSAAPERKAPVRNAAPSAGSPGTSAASRTSGSPPGRSGPRRTRPRPR